MLSGRLLTLAVLSLVLWSPAQAGFTQTFQATGNLHLEVTGAANLNPPAMGTLTLSTLPSGIVRKAYLYATRSTTLGGMSGSFGGMQLPVLPFYASDAQLITLVTYRWDVTNMVMAGMASYSFTLLDGIGNPIPLAGVGLVVVWDDSQTQPVRQVTIVDGVQQVGENGMETESLTFNMLIPGTTTAWVFTTDDDATTTNETIFYNGNNVGGPLVGNLGLNASVVQMPSLTSVNGSNSMAIQTISDHLTWVMAAVAVDQPPVETAPSSFGKVKSRYGPTP